MPSRIWWTLGLLGVKELPHLEVGRKLREEDYTSRGVMQEITEEVWDNCWGMKKRNKAADKDGTTVTVSRHSRIFIRQHSTRLVRNL